MKEKNNRKEIIVIAGVPGSGKSSFSSSFKDSFLKSYPLLPLIEGLKSGNSFACELSLATDTQLFLLHKAKEDGYGITVYYLFTGKLLSSERALVRQISMGIPFDEALFRSTYEASYKGLGTIYPDCELVFFVKNQKYFEFVSAFDPNQVTPLFFKNQVALYKKAVDHIK